MTRKSRQKDALLGLKRIDYRFKYIPGYKDWNVKVKNTFIITGSFSFEDLVMKDLTTAEYLISRFKG